MNKVKSGGAIFWRCLRRDAVVAGARHLQAGGNDQSNVRGRAIGGVIMEGKPPRGIHQIRAFRTYISQALGSQRSAFRRNQGATPAKSQCDRLIGRHNLSKINSHTWPKRSDPNRILNKTRQGLAAKVDAFYLQGSVEFEDE